ncbi:MAG: hypothetical protein MJZ66_00435 [Bacteroidales bacterium]|nr:hypothetical protein [Bacteroidales bacterium]
MMRKRITILMLMLLMMASPLMAQHLNFMGTSIDGTVEDFSAKMETKGFKKVTKNSMKGYFGGYYCTIVLNSANGMANKKEDIIANVKVRFNEYQSVSPDIFHNLSKWLTVKYGAYQEYPDMYVKEEYGYRVCMSRAWIVDNGTIVLNFGTEVQLTYIDRVRATDGNSSAILNDL